MSDLDQQTKTAAHLSAIELSLGSVLHGFKIPFGGHLLSLNQGLFLTQYLNQTPQLSRIAAARDILEISSITAALKSLSPAGQKIGPMLSLTMQGGLYGFGLLIGGTGFLGKILGLIFLSLWAFIQPVLTFFVVFGIEFQRMLDVTLEKLPSSGFFSASSLGSVFLGIVLIKMTLATMVVFASYPLSRWVEKTSFFNMKTQKIPTKTNSPAWGAVRDLTRPLFMISFLVLLVVLYVTESRWSVIVWQSLRPLGLGFLIFYLVRSPWFTDFLKNQALRFSWSQKISEKASLVYKEIMKRN